MLWCLRCSHGVHRRIVRDGTVKTLGMVVPPPAGLGYPLQPLPPPLPRQHPTQSPRPASRLKIPQRSHSRHQARQPASSSCRACSLPWLGKALPEDTHPDIHDLVDNLMGSHLYGGPLTDQCGQFLYLARPLRAETLDERSLRSCWLFWHRLVPIMPKWMQMSRGK